MCVGMCKSVYNIYVQYPEDHLRHGLVVYVQKPEDHLWCHSSGTVFILARAYHTHQAVWLVSIKYLPVSISPLLGYKNATRLEVSSSPSHGWGTNSSPLEMLHQIELSLQFIFRLAHKQNIKLMPSDVSTCVCTVYCLHVYIILI